MAFGPDRVSDDVISIDAHDLAENVRHFALISLIKAFPCDVELLADLCHFVPVDREVPSTTRMVVDSSVAVDIQVCHRSVEEYAGKSF